MITLLTRGLTWRVLAARQEQYILLRRWTIILDETGVLDDHLIQECGDFIVINAVIRLHLDHASAPMLRRRLEKPFALKPCDSVLPKSYCATAVHSCWHRLLYPNKSTGRCALFGSRHNSKAETAGKVGNTDIIDLNINFLDIKRVNKGNGCSAPKLSSTSLIL